jgi:hypothetical protein
MTTMSFALFSGNTNELTIYMAASVAGRLPTILQEFVTEDESKDHELAVNDWS